MNNIPEKLASASTSAVEHIFRPAISSIELQQLEQDMREMLRSFRWGLLSSQRTQ